MIELAVSTIEFLFSMYILKATDWWYRYSYAAIVRDINKTDQDIEFSKRDIQKLNELIEAKEHEVDKLEDETAQ